jgi:hypothetical protein
MAASNEWIERRHYRRSESTPSVRNPTATCWRQIVATIGGNPSEIRCTLVQKCHKLAGACKPAQFNPSEVAGTVTRANAKWSYDFLFNGNKNHVEYEAVLGADGKLAGTLHLGPMPVAFTAVRE